MVKDVKTLVKFYLEGTITGYELFARTRELGKASELPEMLQKEYAEWDEAHPAGKCLTFSIFA